MNKLFLLLSAALIIMGCSSKMTEKEDATLRFNSGKFKIAQITDMHYGISEKRDSIATRKMIQSVLAAEKPDLIVLTGDNITDASTLEENEMLWKRILGILDATNIPYAIVMGNHDAEACDSVNADYLEKWISESAQHCLNYPTTTTCFGHGNKALEILSEHSDSVAAVVYTIDSNDYPRDEEMKKYSYYDWIHKDQIDWYNEQSHRYTAQNGGVPVPSLAYFHICVPEFDIVAHDNTHYGHYCEGTAPADLNTGFFATAVQNKDIMGMFVGHDHTNDYCGILYNIALCYGRQSGVEGMDENAPLGMRFVELTEGKHTFETWIRTSAGKEETWYYPTGINSAIRRNLLPAMENISKEDLTNGVNYTYYEGSGKSLDVVLTPANKCEEGVMNTFDISKAKVEDHFGYTYDCYIDIPESDGYSFRLKSDDGAALYIDDVCVFNNDGSHRTSECVELVGLAKGLHHMKLRYFEDYMGQELTLTICSLSMPEQPIPESMLYVVNNDKK